MKKRLFILPIVTLILIFLLIGCDNNSSTEDPEDVDRTNLYYQDIDVFHDQAAEYISNYEPNKDENVILRIKVRHNSTERAYIEYTFDYNKVNPKYYQSEMKFEAVDITGKYDYFVGAIPANEAPYQYHFHLKNKVDDVFYNQDGLFNETPTSTSGDWSVIPEFSTPLWSQGALWYSIMPESFYNDNTLNDKTGSGWDAIWGAHNTWAGDWFGGDISGIENKEDYLYNELKITSVFLNPIWITAHNAGYGSYDFYQIDSALGNDVEFLKLVQSLHENELKIMLDAVFEYCNVNNILNNITKMYPDLIKDSYYNLLQREEDGTIIESYWSGALIDFSKEITRKYIYTEEESVMLSYIILFGIDAWRMDVGNTLQGTDKENWGTATQILEDIRPYLKEVSDDILYLSEHADSNQLTDGILDSKWSYAFNDAVLTWCQDSSNAKILESTLRDAMYGYPRGVTNSLYNFLTTHDTERFYELIKYDKTSFMSAEILMMTYLGSPCIYFGEEYGLISTEITDSNAMENSFYTSMNWDETTYDYEIFNLVKSLVNLRNEYSDVFKTGGYMNLYSEYNNNENDIYAYARFNNDVVITTLNRNNHFVNDFELNLERLNIKDGTVLYDYLTNQKYVVKDSKVTINIAPSGSILTLKPNPNFVSSYETTNPLNYINVGINTFELNGNSEMMQTFLYKTSFINSKVVVKNIELSENSKYLIGIKAQNNSDLYGVVVENNKLQLVYNVGGQYTYGSSTTVNKDDVISVARESDNLCKVYINGVEYQAFTMAMDFEYQVQLGVSQIDGVSKIEMSVEKLTEQYGTSFENSSSMLYYEGNNASFDVQDSALVISGDSQTNFAITQAHMTDFTVQAEVLFAELSNDDFAGLVAYQTKDDYIMFGKYNNKIVISHVVNGKVAKYGSIDAIDNVTLQLEKVGTTYRAVVVNGLEYIEVGRINVNYSDIMVGVVNSSSKQFVVKSFGFGNLKDLYADYKYVGEINFDDSTYLDSSLTIAYEIITGSAYSYNMGAIVYSNINDDSKYLMSNLVKNYTTTASLKFTEFKDENSYVGFSFDNSSKNEDNGYTVRIFKDGSVKLFDAYNVILSENKIDNFKLNEMYKFHVKVVNNYIYVYCGEEQLILSYDSRNVVNGYFSYISHNASYSLHSYNTYKEVGNYFQYEGSMYVNKTDETVSLELSSNNNINYAGLRDQGYNDITLGFNLQLNRINNIMRGYFHINIGVAAGHYYLEGLIIKFDDKGRVSIYEDGVEVVAPTETNIDNISSIYVNISYVGNKLIVKGINYNEDKAFDVSQYFTIVEYESSRKYTGTLSFYSKNAGVKLNNIKGYSIDSNTDVSSLDSYTDIYMDDPIPPNGEVSSNPGEDYSNDFSTNTNLSTLDRYAGQVSIADGNLVVNGYTTTNWDAGAAITSGTYDNFTLQTRVKIGETSASGAFVGVEFYKGSPSVNHQASALTVIIYPTGHAMLFIGNGILSSYGVSGIADEDGYYTLNVTVNNGILTFDLGGDSISVKIDSLSNNGHLTNGYISLNAGASIAYFDYVTIKKD